MVEQEPCQLLIKDRHGVILGIRMTKAWSKE